jgi:hypothetical protein
MNQPALLAAVAYDAICLSYVDTQIYIFQKYRSLKKSTARLQSNGS